MGVHVKLSSNGRISLPAAMRKRLGLVDGANVVIQEMDDGLLIQSTEQAVDRVRRWTRDVLGDRPGTSVDDFLAEKRREAVREDE